MHRGCIWGLMPAEPALYTTAASVLGRPLYCRTLYTTAASAEVATAAAAAGSLRAAAASRRPCRHIIQ